ncbi:hypothetical protein THRCLA_20809 [Thraustotheca clavata]|uniref:PH domain-containing protein n=1 Tax=Thraustotheca clavata TaxID=74557 RepID=A0A1W0A392_9STRA|nr:hypothetical protein THRCLA_20809 [Thraustotheca clavata]
MNAVMKSGVLFKKGSGMGFFHRRNWKPRYFELTMNALNYYDEQGGKLKGKVVLHNLVAQDIEIMPCDGVKTGKSASTNWRICINLPSRRFFVAAATEHEMYQWIQALVYVVNTNHKHENHNGAILHSLRSIEHPIAGAY